MILKKFVFKSPLHDVAEEVYEYPDFLASPMLRLGDCILVSRLPMTLPIIVAPKNYLRDLGEGYSFNCQYADLTYINHWDSEVKTQIENKKQDDKMERVKEMFAIGTAHKRRCKTIFFTGPKPVYKQTFVDNWVWLETNVLALTNIGCYRNIDSLSLKGINEVFISGEFECEGEVLKNTQCKITLSVSA